jgi:molecular chaperone DnaK
MSKNLVEIYEQRCLGLIETALRNVAGRPTEIITNETLFRQHVTDPTWNSLPAPLRMFGRAQLRWDAFFAAVRKDIFLGSGGKVTLRPDTRARLAALARQLFGSDAPGTPARPAAPVAAPATSGKGPINPLLTVLEAMEIPEPGKPTPPAEVAPAVLEAIPIVEPVESPPAAKATPAAPVLPVIPIAAPVKRPSAVKVAPPPAPGVIAVEPPVQPAIAVGIDLGTTYSVVAHLDAYGRPWSIPNAAGDILTPSVVLFDAGGPVIGKEAVLAAAMEPEKIAECVKRDMGSKAYRKKINGEYLPPEVISSFILRSLKADAERKLGPVRKAVITVPAYFDDSRRRATMDAGRLAGLEVLDILNEPTAAAIAYGYQLGFLDRYCQLPSDKPLRVLVFDLGGGTFDVTIVEIQGKSFKALATDGDVCLGGKDWDEQLITIAAEAFIHQHREDPRTNPSSLQELWIAVEVAKKTLTERPKTSLYVNHLGTRLKVEVTREQFEEATAALLARTRTTTEIVVRQAGLSWADIDKVLLVGGSTRMPVVPHMLEELSGKKPERSVSADEAVAHGAALYADLLLQSGKSQAPQFSITNVNSHSLGIVGVEASTGRRRNQILIPKNTPLPHSVTKVFKTHKPNQSSVAIRVVEGESERPEACIEIGLCSIGDLPPNLPAGWPVQVRYSYEANGRLHVNAKLKGQQEGVTTHFLRSSSLSENDMALWLEYILQETKGIA